MKILENNLENLTWFFGEKAAKEILSGKNDTFKIKLIEETKEEFENETN